MTRSVPVETRSHRRLFAALSLALVAVTAWAVVDEVDTRRPWKAHQAAWLAVSGEPDRGVRQLVVPELDAVDRCITCHAGVDRDGEREGVLAAHPQRELLLGAHPPERFGCVACHRGLGLALTEETAHAPEEGPWPDPMLTGVQVQAACLACHRQEEQLEGAPLLSQGRALFAELGCGGCHLAEGPEELRRGPSLRHVASKLRPDALLEQIRTPEARRRGFRMPAFWPDDEAKREEDSAAIAAFLVSASEPWGQAPPQGGQAPSAAAPQRGQAPSAAEGQRLFDRIGCRGCHVLGTPGGDDVVIGEVVAEADAWGDFGGGDAWGDFGGGGAEPAEEPAEAPSSPPALGHGPALGAIAARLQPGFFAPWLLDPASYSPHTTMPSLRLTAAEAADLAAWLATLGPAPPAAPLETSPTLIERGQALVADYGCFGCHDIPGFEDEGRSGPDLTEYGHKARQQMHFGAEPKPATGAWTAYTRTKLRAPRAFEGPGIPQFMPAYSLTDPELTALTVYLRALRGTEPPPPAYQRQPADPAPVRRGRALAAQLNCGGCHTLDGQDGGVRRHLAQEHRMPPTLDGEGARVRPDWLYGFLLEPSPLRPWLDVRMPSFDLAPEEAEALVAWLGHRDGQPEAWRASPSRPLSRDRAALGEAMFADLKCVTCHQLATSATSADLAPDLGLARHRLDRRWIRRFLEDPGALLPGTRMPQFFPDGQSPFPDLLGGDADAQMELLVDHLMNLGLQPSGLDAPPPALATRPDDPAPQTPAPQTPPPGAPHAP